MSARFHAGQILNLYRRHYSVAFAPSSILYPLSLGYPLRASTFCEGDNGVATFLVCNKRQVRGSLSPPVAFYPYQGTV